jgi:hypothetical protein
MFARFVNVPLAPNDVLDVKRIVIVLRNAERAIGKDTNKTAREL